MGKQGGLGLGEGSGKMYNKGFDMTQCDIIYLS